MYYVKNLIFTLRRRIAMIFLFVPWICTKIVIRISQIFLNCLWRFSDFHAIQIWHSILNSVFDTPFWINIFNPFVWNIFTFYFDRKIQFIILVEGSCWKLELISSGRELCLLIVQRNKPSILVLWKSEKKFVNKRIIKKIRLILYFHKIRGRKRIFRLNYLDLVHNL